jgi:hypothetical protein
MLRDWKEISNDEILNFDGSQTAIMARYERIMQQRSTDAVVGLRDKITGLMETIYRASQGIQEKTDKLFELYNSISRSQARQQIVIIVLSVVVAVSTAAYTWITWQSVAAMREANEIQRQLLQLQTRNTSVPTAPTPMIVRHYQNYGGKGGTK